jgi:hypothetical protein
MKIIIQNDLFEFSNEISEIENIFELIGKRLEDLKMQFSHLIIDDELVYENYEEYFFTNIKKIKQVEVISNSLKSLIDETLYSTYTYLKSGKSLVQDLANTFYQKPQEESWNNLSDLFGGIEWIIETQDQIDQIKGLETLILSNAVWNEYVQEVNKVISILPELETAMKQQDFVLIGDLLLYEIFPFFETGSDKLRFLIPGEGENHVS